MLKVSLCDALSFPNAVSNTLETASENSFSVRINRNAKYLLFNCFLHADFAMLHVKNNGKIVWSQEIHFHGCDYHIAGPFKAGEQLEISLEVITPVHNDTQLAAEIAFTAVMDILVNWSRGSHLGAVCNGCNYNRRITTKGYLDRILPDEVISLNKDKGIISINSETLYI